MKVDEAAGESIEDILIVQNGETIVPAENLVTRAIRERCLLNSKEDAVLITESGEGVPIDYSAAPLRDLTGKVIGTVLVIHAKSDNTHIEKQLRKITAERNKLEEQFRQSQKLESIGRLAGGVAHDFNNLLTVINGYSQMLLDETPIYHPFRERLEQISSAGSRATAMTRQLLTFSRRQSNESRIIVLNDIVRDFETILGRLIGEDIQLVVSLDAQAGAIEVDPGQIEQVIMNLAVNAKDAMPEGGKLTLETSKFIVDKQFAQSHLSVTRGSYAVLAVTDTGVGMAPAVQAQIFEPFFTTKEPGKGTGLGLSTVYGIVAQSGGSICVYSEPGCGTTFKLLFPLIGDDPEQFEPVHAERAQPGNETILVVEDDDSVRKYVRDILEQQGYTVLEASNGCDAIEVSLQYPTSVDLLVTNSVMPELGGPELFERLSSRWPNLGVLCMSDYGRQVWPRATSVQTFIQKPFTAADLLTQTRFLLDKRRTSS